MFTGFEIEFNAKAHSVILEFTPNYYKMKEQSTILTHKRIEYIDAMRGFTMLLVVFGHVLTLSLNNYTEDSIVYCFFERFRMPIFFFISGYIAYKATAYWNFNSFKMMLKEKAIAQLILTFIFFLFWEFIHNSNLLHNFMANGTGIFWFCQALFEMFLIYYTVVRHDVI